MNRREFTRLAAAGTAGIGMSPTIITGSGWKGANDRVNVAVIRNTRTRGKSYYRIFSVRTMPGLLHYVMLTATFLRNG